MTKKAYSNYPEGVRTAVGRMKFSSLFAETTNYPDLPALYTLGDQDRWNVEETRFYKSIRKIYLEIGDPTEYLFAQKVFGSWEHWVALREKSYMKKHVERWRYELEVRTQAAAVQEVMNQLKSDNKATALAAAKYMAERGWEKKQGRPSKADMERKQSLDKEIASQVTDDYKRLVTHLKVVGE